MKYASQMKWNKWKVLLLAFVFVSFCFSFVVIKNFSTPLTGWTGIGPWGINNINFDYVDTQEYPGFYFAKNLKFNPFPQLNLINNQSFYPYGTNSVYQPWVVEKDIFYAILYWFFGIGPWLQVYYLLSVMITAVGTFSLLLGDYGFAKASGAGFIVSFCNFYAIHKYPHHFNLAIVHWTILGIITDFLIVKRVGLRQHVSLKLLLVRGCLLLLSIGQELGYIAGFTLMSFTVSILFIAVVVCYRYLRGEFRLIELGVKKVEAYKNDFVATRKTCLALISISIIPTFLYLPLVIQIVREAKKFEFSSSGIDWWVNPLRLLIPFFPMINPEKNFDKIFLDVPEALGDGSPGWFLLIVGTIGLWQARRKIIIFIPLLIIFVLCLLYAPNLWLFPTLKIFPWFAFNRVSGRSTVIYPVILCILALHINFDWLSLRKRQLLSGLLVLLACVEFYTAYSFKKDYQPYVLDKNFFAYMDYVKKQPGEAVLDWPFCALGGNGPAICTYYRNNSGIFALRRFHEKKVMGQYYGRLHPSLIEPYFQAGWDKLFIPDITKTRQARCFREGEWSFFTEFYKLNDFAGINLYVDRLPEGCAKEFHKRFGYPTKETFLPDVGRIQFIQKTPELRKQVNLSLGTKVKFDPLLDLSESDLLKVKWPYGLTVVGLGEIEKNEQSNNIRGAGWSDTVLTFKLSNPQPLELSFRFDNITGDQLDVEVNGSTLERIVNMKSGETIERKLKFQGLADKNSIVFKYKNKYKKAIWSWPDLVEDIVKSQGIIGLNPVNIVNRYRDYEQQRVLNFPSPRYKQIPQKSVRFNKLKIIPTN
jgi:hypothetical protein